MVFLDTTTCNDIGFVIDVVIYSTWWNGGVKWWFMVCVMMVGFLVVIEFYRDSCFRVLGWLTESTKMSNWNVGSIQLAYQLVSPLRFSFQYCVWVWFIWMDDPFIWLIRSNSLEFSTMKSFLLALSFCTMKHSSHGLNEMVWDRELGFTVRWM